MSAEAGEEKPEAERRMRGMRVNVESVAGAGVVLLSVAAALVARRFPAASGAVPGPAMFPLAIAGFWAMLGIALLATSRWRCRADAVAGPSSKRMIALLALTVAYAASMPTVGFIASSALYSTLAIRLLGYPHGWRAGAVGLSAAFLVYGLFAGVMKVPLPAGWLG